MKHSDTTTNSPTEPTRNGIRQTGEETKDETIYKPLFPETVGGIVGIEKELQGNNICLPTTNSSQDSTTNHQKAALYKKT